VDCPTLSKINQAVFCQGSLLKILSGASVIIQSASYMFIRSAHTVSKAFATLERSRGTSKLASSGHSCNSFEMLLEFLYKFFVVRRLSCTHCELDFVDPGAYKAHVDDCELRCHLRCGRKSVFSSARAARRHELESCPKRTVCAVQLPYNKR
jgi:hypothetical protein